MVSEHWPIVTSVDVEVELESTVFHEKAKRGYHGKKRAVVLYTSTDGA